jgi:hypothetical protein
MYPHEHQRNPWDMHMQGRLAELDQERHMHAKVAAKKVEDSKMRHEEQLKAEAERTKRVKVEVEKLHEDAKHIECQVCFTHTRDLVVAIVS